MHLIAAIAAALGVCLGMFLNDLLSRRRKALIGDGLLGQGFDDADTAGFGDADPRLVRYGILRLTANAMGLLFVAASALLIYQAIFVLAAVDTAFWAAWGASTAAAALLFWAGR